jgi:patatin-like phospholipase/acyl hydrolase
MSQKDHKTGGTVPNRNGENDLETTGLCLLSLDGGGVRGLSTLYILRALMERLNDERHDAKLDRVKPCEIFDLIGGTSTGG